MIFQKLYKYFTYARKNQEIKKLVLKASPDLQPEELLNEISEISKNPPLSLYRLQNNKNSPIHLDLT